MELLWEEKGDPQTCTTVTAQDENQVAIPYRQGWIQGGGAAPPLKSVLRIRMPTNSDPDLSLQKIVIQKLKKLRQTYWTC